MTTNISLKLLLMAAVTVSSLSSVSLPTINAKTTTNKQQAVLKYVDTNHHQLTTAYQYTRFDMEQMLVHKNEVQYQMPLAKASQIKDLQAFDTFTPGHYGEPLDVWDSWPVKDANGNVAVINGYRVVMALVGNPNKQIPNYESGKIGIFYQAVTQAKQGIGSWHYAGILFNSPFEGAKNKQDPILSHETGEWSGSAMLQKNGKIRLMYTSFSGSKAYGGYDDNRQTLMTAQVSLMADNSGININHHGASDRRAVFAGDNHYYEDVAHSTDITGFTKDDHTLRDPQIFEANGHTYVLFEGNTARGDGLIGANSLKQRSYYGGNQKFYQAQQQLLKQNPLIQTYNGETESLVESAKDANGCLGLLELTNNYHLKKVLPPLVTFNLVDDETERPSIVQANHRWYIFTAMHGWHMASPNAGATDSFMLGFSSDQLTRGYQPLNRYGLVMHTNQDINSRTFTYSYSMNQQAHQPYLLTSYITQLATPQAGGHSTFAPSVEVYLNNTTTKMNAKPLAQGVISR